MGYGLGMMSDICFIWSGILHTQAKISVSEKHSNIKRYTAGSASIRLCALCTHVVHYITLVLGVNKGQKDRFKKCFILVLVYVHGD